MKNNVYFILIFVGLVYCLGGCKSNTSLAIFKRLNKLNVNDFPERNNGNYYLCFLAEDPLICVLDSSLLNTFPKCLRNDGIEFTFIKISVKPVDMYFTKYSREEALKMWLALYSGFFKMGEEYNDPNKESFLDFNTVYYITCNASEIRTFKKMYNKKALMLFDQRWPASASDYYYSFNAYAASSVDFNRLYSFDQVLNDYKEGKAKIEQNK